MSFTTEPYFYGSRGARRRLGQIIEQGQVAAAITDTPRVAICSDSTLTSPGQGSDRLIATIVSIGGLFGNIPSTPLARSTSHESAPFMWPVGASLAASRITAANLPPGITPALIPGKSTSALGLQLKCHHDGINTSTTLGLWQGLFGDDDHYLEILANAHPTTSGQIQVSHRPLDQRDGLNGFASEVATSDSNLTLVDATLTAGDLSIQTLRVGPYSRGANAYNQWLIRSNSNSDGWDYIGARIYHSDPTGWIIDSLSAAGYTTASWFGSASGGISASHANAGDFLAQVGYDIIVIDLGRNDLYGARDAATAATDLWNASGDPNKGMIGEIYDAYTARGLLTPLVLLIDPSFADDDGEANYATRKAQHAIYFAALKGVADAVGGIALNVHRWTYERGWNETSEAVYGLTDNGDWATATSMVADELRDHLGLKWRCTDAHTSGAANEPGVGADWHYFWVPAQRHLADYVHHKEYGAQQDAAGLTALIRAAALTTTPAMPNRPKGVQRNLTSRLTY